MLAARLLDELHLLVHPITVRKGMRLFDKGALPIPFTLISSQAFTTGEVSNQDAKVHLPQHEQ